jgi:hypothetical protein
MSYESERWLPIQGYEDCYGISTLGRVWSAHTNRFLHPNRSGLQGHVSVSLCRRGKVKQRVIHQLVLEAFVGPRPFPDAEARHINGDASDNRLANLGWGTKSENMLDRVTHGTHPLANKTHCLRGHEFSVQNTYIDAKKRRICRTCMNMHGKAWRARRAERAAREGTAHPAT